MLRVPYSLVRYSDGKRLMIETFTPTRLQRETGSEDLGWVDLHLEATLNSEGWEDVRTGILLDEVAERIALISDTLDGLDRELRDFEEDARELEIEPGDFLDYSPTSERYRTLQEELDTLMLTLHGMEK